LPQQNTRFPACSTAVHARLERGRLTDAAVIRFAPRSCFLVRTALRCYSGPLLRDQSETGLLATAFRSPALNYRLRFFLEQGRCSWPMASLCPHQALPDSFDYNLSASTVAGFGAGLPDRSPCGARFLTAAVRCQILLSESTPPPHPSLPSGILLPRDPGLAALILLAKDERARMGSLRRSLPQQNVRFPFTPRLHCF
jgi:hypothetical protein